MLSASMLLLGSVCPLVCAHVRLHRLKPRH